jgi:hypothetical protein
MRASRHRLLAEITDDIKRLFDLGFQKIIMRYRAAVPQTRRARSTAS